MLKAVVNSPVRSGDQTILNGDLVIGYFSVATTSGTVTLYITPGEGI